MTGEEPSEPSAAAKAIAAEGKNLPNLGRHSLPHRDARFPQEGSNLIDNARTTPAIVGFSRLRSWL